LTHFLLGAKKEFVKQSQVFQNKDVVKKYLSVIFDIFRDFAGGFGEICGFVDEDGDGRSLAAAFLVKSKTQVKLPAPSHLSASFGLNSLAVICKPLFFCSSWVLVLWLKLFFPNGWFVAHLIPSHRPTD